MKGIDTMNLFDEFLKKFPPDSDLEKPSEEVLDSLSRVLPEELIDFWKNYGFGNYGNGIIKVINPLDYMDSLYTWLGKEDFSKIPILITGFGDIIYFRQLSEEVNDVCLLDIHYRQINVCAYSFEEFFKDFITDDEIIEDVLKKDLFMEALQNKGDLTGSEIFCFVPALILGGAEAVEYIDKAEADVHQLLLFTLGNS